MDARVDSRWQGTSRREHRFPAYGFVDAALGFALFYVLVDRATPTVVAVLTDALPDVSPSAVGLGLAATLWFVLATTVLDQVRRQLAALGVTGSDTARRRLTARVAPFDIGMFGHLAGVLVGGAVAAVTFDRTLESIVTLIRRVAALDVAAITPGEVVVTVVFFVSFGVATRSLDRLLVGGLRSILAD